MFLWRKIFFILLIFLSLQFRRLITQNAFCHKWTSKGTKLKYKIHLEISIHSHLKLKFRVLFIFTFSSIRKMCKFYLHLKFWAFCCLPFSAMLWFSSKFKTLRSFCFILSSSCISFFKKLFRKFWVVQNSMSEFEIKRNCQNILNISRPDKII